MKIIQSFQARDGQLFESRDDCIAHEQTMMNSELYDHVDINCPGSYVGAGTSSSVWKSTNREVHDYIYDHWSKIAAIMEPTVYAGDTRVNKLAGEVDQLTQF